MKDDDLPPDLFSEVAKEINGETTGPAFVAPTFVPLKDLAFRYVKAVITESGHNKTRAAKTLGIDRRTLYRILARGSVGNVSKY